MNNNVLEIKNLIKDFPGVRAVNNVSFGIKRNTVHCLVGENGAGKSTLIKILTGALPKTSGTIILNGKDYVANNIREARLRGISTVFQELNIVDQLTVEENLFLGAEDTFMGFLRRTDKIKRMIDVAKSLEPSINPRQIVSRLSVAQKQIVEIAKAVAMESEIIIMDEPTAAISEYEVERLFNIIRSLREKKVTVIYISHRLDEIFEIGDYVTVMRDGKHIGTELVSKIKNRSELIKMMIGKTLFESYTPRKLQDKPILLEVKNLKNDKLKDISFEVRRGEIVGFYGLLGVGKTELAHAIYGIGTYKGEIIYNGKKLHNSPDKAIEAGIALVPEERRTQGLFTILTIRNNIPVMNMKKISRSGFINTRKEIEASIKYINELKIATDTIEKQSSKLSGGNQQKVVFSKCLFADSDLLILDEPARGIDVGSKSEIYNIIRQLSEEGKSIMIFSSELHEILNVCDRIFIMYDGRIKVEKKNGPGIDREEIIHIVTGV